ncbi:type II secretion system secretin GspD [Sphaerotilaceae bacterium SBD11-9]
MKSLALKRQRTLLSAPRRPLTAALAAAMLCSSLAPVSTALAQQQPKESRFKGEPVTLNFVNAEIEGVARAMGAILKQQFVVDPRVKGSITLYSEEPLSPREAYLNFLAALRGLGFTVVESGGLFKVVPEADAKLQSSTVSVGAVSRQGDQVLTQIYKLSHENANNLVPVLRPLISPNNTINANPGNNTLVITDYADNLARIAKIIAAMDTPSAGDVEIIPLKYAVATDLATLVQRLSDGGTSATPQGVPGMGATSSVMVDPRSNSLIVRASTPARMASIKGIVEKLDQPTQGNNPMGNIYVVYLKNADATKLATVLRAAYGAGAGAGSSGGGSSLGGGGSSPTSTASQQAIGGSQGNSGASPQATAPVAQSASPSTGGFIQADPSTNSLIITAPEPVYRQLRAVIEQLDSRRAQVYIESLIVKVDANKIVDVGIQWQGASGKPGDSSIVAGGTNYGQPNIITSTAAINSGTTSLVTAAAAVPAGFNIGLLKKIGEFYNIGALARFLETYADGNVLSTPNLIALDNEEAKIVVGQNVPFITGSFTNTGASSGATNPFQTIERKDVGLTLRVKPQIGEGGTVRMTIYQENSTVDPASKLSAQGLTTDKSSIETTVVVDDGQYMVLGGLMKDEYGGSASKVPWLGDIPLLGALFRSDSRNRTKSNLMVFLRPVVIRDQSAATSLTLDRYDVIRAEQQNRGQPGGNILQPIREAPVIAPRPTQPGLPPTGPAPAASAAPPASAPAN